jgi:hypothetical protein
VHGGLLETLAIVVSRISFAGEGAAATRLITAPHIPIAKRIPIDFDTFETCLRLNIADVRLKRYSDDFHVCITRRAVIQTIDNLAVGKIFRERGLTQIFHASINIFKIQFRQGTIRLTLFKYFPSPTLNHGKFYRIYESHLFTSVILPIQLHSADEGFTWDERKRDFWDHPFSTLEPKRYSDQRNRNLYLPATFRRNHCATQI